MKDDANVYSVSCKTAVAAEIFKTDIPTNSNSNTYKLCRSMFDVEGSSWMNIKDGCWSMSLFDVFFFVLTNTVHIFKKTQNFSEKLLATVLRSSRLQDDGCCLDIFLSNEKEVDVVIALVFLVVVVVATF